MSTDIKSTSSDGRFQVRVKAWEAGHSLWVESPSIWDTRSEEILCSFVSELWSLDQTEWKTNDVVALTLRKYPGNHTPSQLKAVIHCETKTAEIQTLRSVPLTELERSLESHLTWGSHVPGLPSSPRTDSLLGETEVSHQSPNRSR